MAGSTLEFTDANFDELTRQGVALVDFWALRCPPCRLQGPIVETVAESFAGRAAVGKLDVDSNSKVPARFALQFIPTLVILKDGEEVKRFTGLQQEATLASALEGAITEG